MNTFDSLLEIARAGTLGLIIVAGSVLITALILLIWVASGSRDVNGDPERDASESPVCGHPLPSDGRGAGGEGKRGRIVPEGSTASSCARRRARRAIICSVRDPIS